MTMYCAFEDPKAYVNAHADANNALVRLCLAAERKAVADSKPKKPPPPL